MSANNASVPAGCGPFVDPLYYNLCDLGAVWGIVLEALAAAGVVFSLVLFVSLLASQPFVVDKNRRSAVALHGLFLTCTGGLFCLAFAFIVGKDFATCAARRFLFGVLFAGCFACLLMQGVRLNVLARRDAAPPPWALCLGAVALWLVEVVINAEWLIITVVRHPWTAPPDNATVTGSGGGGDGAAATPCNIANQDFVMALIYVMALLLAAVVSSLAVMAGKHGRWKADGAFVLLAGLLSAGVWAAWVAMYLYGNARSGAGAAWDDPTLAVALVANAWVFLLVYTIPEICSLTAENEDDDEEEAGSRRGGYAEDLYPGRRVGYETILKEQTSHNMFMENKAFSMDEPHSGSKPVSPYSGYSGYGGQLRSSVYQPTELALISKGIGNHQQQSDLSYDSVLPRATTAASDSPAHSSNGGSSNSNTPSVHTETGEQLTHSSQTLGNSGNGLHRKAQW